MSEQLVLIDEVKVAPLQMVRNETEALNGTRAIDSDKKVLRNVVKFAVSRAFLTLGKQVSKNDATFIVDGLCAEILRSFPGIRLEEILLSIHRLSMGEFIPIDKIYTLSLSTFVTGIRMYMQSEERANAAKLYGQNVLKLETPTRPSDQEISEMTRQNVLNAFEFYKEKGYFNDYGNSIFKALYNYGGILNFTEEQKVDIWKQARKNVFKYHAVQLHSPQVDRRNDAKRIIAELKQNKDHQFFYVEAQKIALNFIFKDMAEMDIELQEMIDGVKN